MNRSSISCFALFSTGRITTLAVVLVLAGMALPGLKSGELMGWIAGLGSGAGQVAGRAAESGPVSSLSNRARILTTRSRMKGIVAELRLWANRHGMPASGQLTEAVGTATASDSWGHRIRFVAPTKEVPGWLRSYGPDGKPGKDDIYQPVSYADLMGA